MTNKTKKLAIVVSHPIQHFAPFYRALAAHPKIDLIVIYASKIGTKPYFDKGMNTEISWNMDLLGGYEHVFLPEADKITSSTPFGVNNPSVSAALGRIKPDAVLIYGYNQITSLRALWWCRKSNTPAMMISDSELKTRRSMKVKIAKRASVPLILKQFECFLTVGNCNEDYYRHYGVADERLFRSPFTIDESVYRGAHKNRQNLRKEVRQSLKIAQKDIVILTVGKINERKRTRDVINAAELLSADTSFETPITFLMAGNGDMMDELQSEAMEKKLPVKFLGFINVDELPKMYAASDIILHPSSRDPHPLVMSEGACIGMPLVISDRVGAAGPTDIARVGENAIAFPCGDGEAMVRALRRLVDDKSLLSRMSESSRKIFDELDMKRSVSGAVEALDYCLRNTTEKNEGK
ncbi:MAG: glycosyltransferase family 4 protein [Rhizobiaceae bacterium]